MDPSSGDRAARAQLAALEEEERRVRHSNWDESVATQEAAARVVLVGEFERSRQAARAAERVRLVKEAYERPFRRLQNKQTDARTAIATEELCERFVAVRARVFADQLRDFTARIVVPVDAAIADSIAPTQFDGMFSSRVHADAVGLIVRQRCVTVCGSARTFCRAVCVSSDRHVKHFRNRKRPRHSALLLLFTACMITTVTVALIRVGSTTCNDSSRLQFGPEWTAWSQRKTWCSTWHQPLRWWSRRSAYVWLPTGEDNWWH